MAETAAAAAATGPKGLKLYPGYLDRPGQERLLAAVEAVLAAAPAYRPTMPRSDRPFSIRMANAGPLGWVSDKAGYRYQPRHPVTGAPWPPIPPAALEIWRDLAAYPAPPECCLINLYEPPRAKMGLHRDADEEAADAPVVSISLGDGALFRIGGPRRGDRTRSFRLSSGDVVVLAGDARHCYHGIDRVHFGTSTLLGMPGRINLTLRRVTPPPPGF